ncbi:MAG: hypothetical protein NVSMB43_22270 [Pseudarthrobacter sp.]
MMGVMTAQLPLPLLAPEAVEIGPAAALIEDAEGGRVLLHGELAYTWKAGDDASRRLAAAALADLKAGTVAGISAAFGIEPGTLWRWRRRREQEGVAGLVSDKRGPKGTRILTGDVVAEILRRRQSGQSLRAIGASVGMSASSVSRALEPGTGPAVAPGGPDVSVEAGPLPVVPGPADRSPERAAARAGLIRYAEPAFTPAARVPLAGLFLALPALEATGLLSCAREVYGALPSGFYGLETMLTESVFRTLSGEPRAEGSTRIDPTALGRVLGLDRSPEVKTIRRKLGALAAAGKAPELLQAMASRLLERKDGGLAAVLYVDGHVRAYQGTRKIAKNHSTRLKFPAPATVETWVSDADGDPVLVVMAEPGAALTGELRRLLPTLREIIGNDRRVLVGFDRGGWSPALFAHMAGKGFDVLTWRKGATEDIENTLFTTVEYVDEAGRTHAWEAADTMVDLHIDEHGTLFRMRQITRKVDSKTGSRQIHILTTRTDPGAAELIYRMGSRWRQENYFRYARMHFDLDSHDSYATTDDDPDRTVPNQAKRAAHQLVLAARARYDRAAAQADAGLLAARTPAPGMNSVLVTNVTHNAITAPLRAADTALREAQAAHREIPARIRLGDIAPGQQVLDVNMKLLTHAIRMAAFTTETTLARDIRINTGYARAGNEAHTLIRQALTHSGDIDPTEPGYLTIRLDPLPTPRATKAIAELCDHLTATKTRYPGTELTMRYEIKNPR